jgi:hypothetical protein
MWSLVSHDSRARTKTTDVPPWSVGWSVASAAAGDIAGGVFDPHPNKKRPAANPSVLMRNLLQRASVQSNLRAFTSR